ncbi:LAGLIDADG family homing endonuclease [Halorubrum amylolyticum]|uniref:LAGLIDADG family homing endonuclease n=1 Tax=Halorubrum amylolyticum TaxID=2508724 RepID=UPI001008BE49|nr:LAGLIDADG family homing endonuclease [Halorubrum amylolyticum]
MAQAGNQDLTERFIQFYRNYYREEIGQLAQRYPNEQRSLYVEYDDLYQFDRDLAEDFRTKPEQMREYAEEALRLYDLPADVSLGRAHVRIENLPESIDIRGIRVHDDHIGKLVSIKGIVRKATDVRPKVTEAAFECQRCGTMTYIPQSDGGFQEPHECQGCERQGPFRVNFDQSEFIDSQKLRIQESPEGLRGGETPQSIDIDIVDDITGEVSPGDHVTCVGVLHIEQVEQGNEKSAIFDLYMDGVSIGIEDEEFEDMDITEADKREIIELSNRDDIYDAMVDSIAPAIYGYEEEKLAMILQLFSGVTKHLPDGSRIRGDLHMLLIGDPGTGKSQMISYVENIAPRSVYTSGKGSSAAGLCVTGDTKIHTSDGFVPIREIATEYHTKPVDVETSSTAEHDLYTFDRASGRIDLTESSHVWRMPEKPCRRIETAHGKDLEASVNTPVLVCDENGIEWKSISDVDAGDHIGVPKYTDIDRSSPPVREYVEFTEEKIKPTAESVEFLRDELTEEFGTLRDAAAELGLSEDFVYDTLSNRHIPLDKLDTVLAAIGTAIDDIDIDRVMLRHGGGVTIPDEFDANLMYLIGLVFGDGDVMVSRRGGNRGHVRISNSDEELLERAADIIETKFGKSVDIEYQEDRVPCVRLHSATVARFFSNVGVESPKDDIALDPKLTTAEHADAFLRGLFDVDGSVCGRDNGGSSVQFSTVCSELAEQVQLMLETYGVRSRTRERDRRGTYKRADGHEIESTSVQTHLAIYGKELDRFAGQIGFRSTNKSGALDKIVNDAPRRGEFLPIGSTLARADGGAGEYWQNLNRGEDPSRDRTLSMIDDLDLGDVGPVVEEVANADLVWDEVVDAEDTGEKEVFDLTVPDTHNFLGNGLVTHNTAAAVRDDFGDGQQWSLEAGALVLADKGIAAVDELDKMDCVTGDTLVSLANGRVERIDELAREAAEDGEIEELSNGRRIRGVDLDVWSMDEDGRLVERPVCSVHEYDAPSELTRVTMETGESLTATADHPFFVLDDGERVEREAAALDAGDWVYVPRAVPTKAADGAGAVTTENGAADAEFADTGSADDGEGVDTAMASVLGYLSGDGNVYYDREEGVYGVRFTNTDDELLADFERAAREAFGAEPVRPPSEKGEGGVETVRVTGKGYADGVLEAGMNLGRYDEKCFPTPVSTGNRAAKAAFVRALADSEGHVDESAGNVRIASASRGLLRGTRTLLLQFGVSSQLQRRGRNGGRDVYYLTVTDADSLGAFHRAIGFTATRKAEALDRVVEAADGDRTILDVIPEVDDTLARCRGSLRLHQSECGLDAGTYHDFESGTANVSLHRACQILAAFEDRLEAAAEDRRALDGEPTWELLTEIRDRYHVSQSELAEGTALSQQQISREWGESSEVRRTVIGRLREVLTAVAETDLGDLREFVRGDVKWRRVESVETVPTESTEHRREVLRQRLADVLGGPVETVERRARNLLERDPIGETREEKVGALDAYGVSQADVASSLDVDQATVSRWLSGSVETDRLGDLREAIGGEVDAVKQELRSLFARIEDGRTPKVYDLTVEGTHNFVASGLVVHNSSDRSAMHEGLEQQKISVSKAGINATLKARCSLLGAANPKYGRFDQYEPIGEQIDLEPALISRFDLIFTVTDSPDPEHDSRLAKHIIKTNYAGELNTQREELASSEFTSDQVAEVTQEVAPEIDAELLRKYIAHAKRSCYPTMTEEAKELIEEFYVDLRSKGADEDAPVPVTARKLEAMVRLSEASARVRLSDTVEREDADRATDIVESCLKDIGVDPETGQFDADVVETGTSKSQRDRIKNIKGLIADIEEEFEEGAPVDEVLDRAGEIGMDPGKAEGEIEKLRTKGEVYEPKQGHLRTT